MSVASGVRRWQIFTRGYRCRDSELGRIRRAVPVDMAVLALSTAPEGVEYAATYT